MAGVPSCRINVGNQQLACKPVRCYLFSFTKDSVPFLLDPHMVWDGEMMLGEECEPSLRKGAVAQMVVPLSVVLFDEVATTSYGE